MVARWSGTHAEFVDSLTVVVWIALLTGCACIGKAALVVWVLTVFWFGSASEAAWQENNFTRERASRISKHKRDVLLQTRRFEMVAAAQRRRHEELVAARGKRQLQMATAERERQAEL